MRRTLAATAAAVVILAGAAIALGQGTQPLTGGDGSDRLIGGPGADTIAGGRGPDRLEGRAGNDTITGGPGYDTLLGGPGDDRLTDGSHGPDLLDAGAGDDVISSAPRGMDRVRCGPGEDRAEADASDIVGTDCETVDRPAGPLVTVRSLEGVILGQTSVRWAEGNPLRLLWAVGGNLFFAGPFRGSGFCFISVTPGVISSVCGPVSDTRGSLFVRGSRATGYRWFAFTPPWAEAVTVGARRIPVHDGIAVFAARWRPGPIVAVADGRSLRLRLP